MKVQLSKKTIVEALAKGSTWLKSEDTDGLGSIQEIYDLTEEQILSVKQHPKLIGLEPVEQLVIEVIDDTDPETPRERFLFIC